MVDRKFLLDAAERVVVTFIQVAIAVVVASGADWVDVNTWEAAGLAGGAAALSALKAVIARRFGDAESASFVK